MGYVKNKVVEKASSYMSKDEVKKMQRAHEDANKASADGRAKPKAKK